MAELDFAFLAEHARIEPNGIMSAVGIAWTHLLTDRLPLQFTVSVAGRVWFPEGQIETALRVTARVPGSAFALAVDDTVRPLPDERVLQGRRSATFATVLFLPVSEVGLCTIHLSLDSELCKELAFEVVDIGPQVE